MRGGKIRVILERSTEHRDRIFEVLHFVEVLQVAAALQIKIVCSRFGRAMRGKRLPLLRFQLQLESLHNALRDPILQAKRTAGRAGARAAVPLLSRTPLPPPLIPPPPPHRAPDAPNPD